MTQEYRGHGVVSKNDINAFIINIVGLKPVPSLLLQYLCAIQRQYSYIPEQAIQSLETKLAIPAMQIKGVIDFYSFLHLVPQGDFDILFSDSITDHMLGSKELLHQLCDELNIAVGKPRNDGRVTVNTTSCTGICDQGPAILVNSVTVTNLDSRRITKIAELIESNTPLEQWPNDFFSVKDNIKLSGPILDKNMAAGDALNSLLKLGAEAVLDELDSSDLRGRGGAGFKTASKWLFCRNAKADEHYVVCNADEGEPGTFKDRVLLQSYAEELIEGMTLCAGIINARKGFIYLRGEYFYLLDHLEHVLEDRRKQGLLGKKILGKDGFDFDIDIHLGAGAYICGEESALLESLEGKRGIPRNRPPFPVTNGYLNKPTVINNVETLIAAAKIAAHGKDGSKWFRSYGTEQSTGTKLLSISGDCHSPGIYEYPFGTSIKQILEDCGADDCQAIQIAGAAGNTIPASEFDRTISFQDLATAGSFMVFNSQRNMLDVISNFSNFFVHESCGFCTPCRVGGSLLRDIVEKLHTGHATSYDLDEIRNISKIMRETSHCGLGHTAPNAVMDILDKFPQSYQNQLKSSSFEPAFDLNGALSKARAITGRQDKDAFIHAEKEEVKS